MFEDQIPSTREGRIQSIYETVKQYPGQNLQTMISRWCFKFGSQRPTVVDYFKTLERNGKIRISKDMRVYPTNQGETDE